MRTTKSIEEIIDEFIAEKPVTPQSRKTTFRTLLNFFYWCNLYNKNKSSLTKTDLSEYFTYIQSKYSEYYQRTLVIVVKQFFKWLNEKSYWDNVAEHIKTPRVKNTFRKDALTDREILLFQGVFKNQTLIQKRDTAIAMLMLINGLRMVEVSRMNIEDIFKQSEITCIKIQRKGTTTKDDFISLASSWEYIEDYLHEAGRTSGPMFTSLSYNNKGLRLSPGGIGTIINKYLVLSGIKSERITPHSLRHTAACILIQNNFDIYHIQKHLAHTKTEITGLYLQYADRSIKLKDESGNFLYKYYKKLIKNK